MTILTDFFPFFFFLFFPPLFFFFYFLFYFYSYFSKNLNNFAHIIRKSSSEGFDFRKLLTKRSLDATGTFSSSFNLRQKMFFCSPIKRVFFTWILPCAKKNDETGREKKYINGREFSAC